MKNKVMSIIMVLTFCLMVLSVEIACATPMGTEFTYQGRLIDAGSAANGEYEFRFALYDAESIGTQVGSNVDKENVGVKDGYFTVELDFGSNVFTGEARWLQIAVRPGGSTDAYTALNPRQKITAVPYAMNTSIPYGASSVVTGNFFGDDAFPVDPYPIEVDLSALGDVAASDVTVTASAFKWVGPTYEPAFVQWSVSDSPLTATLRVYDKNGTEYDQIHANWSGTELRLSFIAAGPGGGALQNIGQQVVSGKFEYTVNDTPTMPFDIPISVFDVDDINSINVVASGIRNETGGIAAPLAVKSTLVDSSGLKLNLWVWDIYGSPPEDINPAWDGKTLEVSYAIIGPAGGSTGTAGADKVVTDLNLDSDGNIVTGAISQEDYYGAVTRVYLRDLPNLKARLGGSGISLAKVNDSIKKIMLSAQTYLEATQVNFIGFRWARVNGSAIGIDETDIYWPIKVYEDEHTATEDSSATYKLIRVEAHFK